MVEHIDGGTVGEILVRDGDQGDAGDVLIRLDDTLLRSEEANLQAGHAELVARRNRLEAQARATERQRGFIGQELDAQRSLSERGLTDLPELLRLERAAAGLDGQAGDIETRIAEARGRIEEAEEQARENQVRAPVAGEVVGMQVFALREVVRPGEPILRLVPEGAGLVVLARLNPIYVDQVYAGQAAVLRFSAFPSRTTPRFKGRIVRVSADAAHDERTGRSW